MSGVVDKADGVAVRRRIGDRGEPDLAARARPMHDDDPRAAAEVFLEERLDMTRYEIGAAAR